MRGEGRGAQRPRRLALLGTQGLRAAAHISVASFWAAGPWECLSMERGTGRGLEPPPGNQYFNQVGFLKFLVLGVPWLRLSSQKVFPS